MQCMKCGRDLEPGQVFCDSCQKIMAEYPVKPGVVVQLPHRPAHVPKKQQPRRRAAPSAEEQVSVLRRVIRWQVLLIVLLLAAVIGLSWLTVNLYQEGEETFLPGQNYYSANTTEATTAPPTEATELPEYGVAG